MEFSTLNGYKVKDKKAIRFYDTVDDMINDSTLKEGMHVKTKGYYLSGDGGSAEYIIKTTSTGIYEELNNGLVAELKIDNEKINIKQVGCIDDGLTDNTTKLQSLIDNINENYSIFIPSGNFYFANSITVKDKINFIGEEVKQYNVEPTSKLLFNSSGFTGNYSVNFKNLNITGNNHATGTKGIDTMKCTIENCNISKFALGIYTPRTGVITNCHIFDNTIGISGAIDSRIINNFIYNQVDRGIDLYNGSNDNIISNNKIEWNGGNGILAYQTAHNIISNNIFDRNTLYGVTLNSCSTINLIGNTFRRNYVSEGVSDAKSHIRIENSNNCNINNNMTIKGNSLDDSTGIEIPSTSIYITTSHDLNMIGNNFSGAVNKDIATYQNTGNLFRLDLNNQLVPNLETKYGFISLSASGTVTQTIKVDTPTASSPPTFKKIRVQLRRGDNGAGYVKETIVSVFKTWGTTYTVSFNDSNIISDVTLSGTYNDTTGLVTITFTNSSSSNAYSIRVTELAI